MHCLVSEAKRKMSKPQCPVEAVAEAAETKGKKNIRSPKSFKIMKESISATTSRKNTRTIMRSLLSVVEAADVVAVDRTEAAEVAVIEVVGSEDVAEVEVIAVGLTMKLQSQTIRVTLGHRTLLVAKVPLNRASSTHMHLMKRNSPSSTSSCTSTLKDNIKLVPSRAGRSKRQRLNNIRCTTPLASSMLIDLQISTL